MELFFYFSYFLLFFILIQVGTFVYFSYLFLEFVDFLKVGDIFLTNIDLFWNDGIF